MKYFDCFNFDQNLNDAQLWNHKGMTLREDEWLTLQPCIFRPEGSLIRAAQHFTS